MADVPATVLIEDAAASVEAARIRAGEPWCVWQVAGLQYYDYGAEGLDGAPIRPVEGDRLNLVRAPENPADANAVEVWWRNDVRLGHLPRELAAIVAKHLDAGVPLRAYVADGGNGRSWSARALLVGEAVRYIHERRIGREVADGISSHWAAERTAEQRRRRVGQSAGQRFEERLLRVREVRMVQAVAAFRRAVPPDMEEILPSLPPVGKEGDLAIVERAIRCSRSTARRLAMDAGAPLRVLRRGCYSDGTVVTVTPALRAAMGEWIAHHR